MPDYNYAFQPKGEWGTLCAIMRSDISTDLVCDNGFEAELSGLGEELQIGDRRFTRQCD
ncbi:hypothetical protein SAMN05216456_1308 [Devosia crocina]|uniref:Uncharacterized protein n=1 Tax=Devosia crocina TaxID=429728 RepID=A0A1I7N9V8_9HYPH|nr:hypothetical protein SAMN05216456_1308 [Devosia crocina]